MNEKFRIIKVCHGKLEFFPLTVKPQQKSHPSRLASVSRKGGKRGHKSTAPCTLFHFHLRLTPLINYCYGVSALPTTEMLHLPRISLTLKFENTTRVFYYRARLALSATRSLRIFEFWLKSYFIHLPHILRLKSMFMFDFVESR